MFQLGVSLHRRKYSQAEAGDDEDDWHEMIGRWKAAKRAFWRAVQKVVNHLLVISVNHLFSSVFSALWHLIISELDSFRPSDFFKAHLPRHASAECILPVNFSLIYFILLLFHFWKNIVGISHRICESYKIVRLVFWNILTALRKNRRNYEQLAAADEIVITKKCSIFFSRYLKIHDVFALLYFCKNEMMR